VSEIQAGLLLLSSVVVIYLLMWWGWRRRGARHELPSLVEAPAIGDLPPATLESGARYFGTTISGKWLERVVARGLGARSTARIRLSDEGIDVIRLAGSFRIPAEALRGARHDQGIAGKVVPPHGLLVITWQHGDLLLDSGFRLNDVATEAQGTTATHNEWVRRTSKLAKKQEDV
jgi:hypothetical protein